MTTQLELNPNQRRQTRLSRVSRLMLGKAGLDIGATYLLQSLFDYPQILDKRPDLGRAIYNQNSFLINLAFLGLALSGFVLSLIARQLLALVSVESRKRRPLQVLTGLGQVIGALQALTFGMGLTLPLLEFSLFQFLFRLLNQTLLTFGLVVWTFTLAFFLRENGLIGRWQTRFGLLVAAGLELGLVKSVAALFGQTLRPVEYTDFDWAGWFTRLNAISGAFWLIWLIWLALTLRAVPEPERQATASIDGRQ